MLLELGSALFPYTPIFSVHFIDIVTTRRCGGDENERWRGQLGFRSRQTEKGKMAVVRVEDGAAEGVICGKTSGRQKYVSVVGESKNEKCWLLQ
jgi:hypothetical protein